MIVKIQNNLIDAYRIEVISDIQIDYSHFPSVSFEIITRGNTYVIIRESFDLKGEFETESQVMETKEFIEANTKINNLRNKLIELWSETYHSHNIIEID
jgi:hypothetical protein